MSFHRAFAEQELWDGDMRSHVTNGQRFVVLRTDGLLRAYRDICPHLGSTLSDGRLEDGVLTCRHHCWAFSARSGCGVNPSGVRLDAVAIRIVDGMIEIDVDDAIAFAPRCLEASAT